MLFTKGVSKRNVTVLQQCTRYKVAIVLDFFYDKTSFSHPSTGIYIYIIYALNNANLVGYRDHGDTIKIGR